MNVGGVGNDSIRNGKLPSFWRDGVENSKKLTGDDSTSTALLKALQGGLDQLHRDTTVLTSTIQLGVESFHARRKHSVEGLLCVALTGCAVGAALGCTLTLVALSANTRR